MVAAFISLAVSFATAAAPAKLSVKWEELTAPDFVKAVEKAKGTVVVPVAILEKHGAHLPLGTDLLNARANAIRAAEQEYAIVFPWYYAGQINEAKQQPGTIAYSHGLIWNLLQETCDELARNGLKKIILVIGHGGNTSWLHYFTFSQSEKARDYVVYLLDPQTKTAGLFAAPPAEDVEYEQKFAALKKTLLKGGHAGEEETSSTMFNRPDLVHLERARQQSGEDLLRLAHIPDFFTAPWWYARFPNHYAGDGSFGNLEMGKLIAEHRSAVLARAIKQVKADTKTAAIQKHFFEESAQPLKTKQ